MFVQQKKLTGGSAASGSGAVRSGAGDLGRAQRYVQRIGRDVDVGLGRGAGRARRGSRARRAAVLDAVDFGQTTVARALARAVRIAAAVFRRDESQHRANLLQIRLTGVD